MTSYPHFKPSKELDVKISTVKSKGHTKYEVIGKIQNMLRFYDIKQHEEIKKQENELKERLEAEKRQVEKVKKTIEKLKGIKDVIKEYKENSVRDPKWYSQKMNDLHDKNHKSVGYSELKLFLERCIPCVK